MKIKYCYRCKSKDIYQPDSHSNAFCNNCDSYQPIELASMTEQEAKTAFTIGYEALCWKYNKRVYMDDSGESYLMEIDEETFQYQLKDLRKN